MDKDVSIPERIFISISLSIVGLVAGLISRVLYGPVTLLPFTVLRLEVGPWMLIGGILLGTLGYLYPRKLGWILCLLPTGCEFG